MHSDEKTVSAYLKSLPTERKKALSKIRTVIRKNLNPGFAETMNWGMICYEVPLKTYPETYNKKPLMFAALASQKNYMAVYLYNVYSNKKLATWFKKEYLKSGKKMDMGKSCVRFKKLDDLPIELIGQAIAKTNLEQFIKAYERRK